MVFTERKIGKRDALSRNRNSIGAPLQGRSIVAFRYKREKNERTTP
jgi:hypothetical protein